MNNEDRLLFLKYAIPCAPTLVGRKEISAEKYQALRADVAAGKMPEGEPEKIFKVAFAMCKANAQEQGKEIDAEIIHNYFWYRHDAVVEERAAHMEDLDATQCKTYPGKVEEIQGDKARVKTMQGDREYDASFVPGIEKGAWVVVHRDFIVETISRETAELIAGKMHKAYA